MRVGLRQFSSGTAGWLREALIAGELTRSALARQLCEREDWRNRKGELCAASARKALPVLARHCGLRLPAPSNSPPSREGFVAGPAPRTEFAGSLAQLGRVRLVRVEDRGDRATWHALLDACHPLGIGRAPGWRVSYLVRSRRQGVLGGLSFVAAALRLPPRDRYLRWSWRARQAQIAHVVCNDRFLILPAVTVPHLASHVLARAARQLRRDWQEAAGVKPWLLETCVDAAQRGTSYLAAGWQRLPAPTGGRPPGGPVPAGGPKTVWLRPLRSAARYWLRREPPLLPGRFPPWRGRAGEHWSVREFSRSDHFDARVRQRLLIMSKAWDRSPGANLPTVFPERNDRDAAYRLLASPRVTMDDILQPHREAVAERCALEATVLLVQDTTTLNYKGLRKCTKGLGSVGGRSGPADGFFVHAGLALAEGGRALGVYWLRPWARLEVLKSIPKRIRGKESKRWMEGLEQAVELGRACPRTRVITVCDREGDIFPLLRRQAPAPAAHRPHRGAGRAGAAASAARSGGGSGGARRTGERAVPAPGLPAAGLAAAVQRWRGDGRGRVAHGGALRAALADRGILQGAQAQHQAAGPPLARRGQPGELPGVRGRAGLEGVRYHAPGPRAAWRPGGGLLH